MTPSGERDELVEAQLHSFIVKLWLEDATDDTDGTAWRGQIKHVPSGEHRHIKSFDEITDFIRPYVKSKGAGPGARGWLSGWARLLRLH